MMCVFAEGRFGRAPLLVPFTSTLCMYTIIQTLFMLWLSSHLEFTAYEIRISYQIISSSPTSQLSLFGLQQEN